MAWSLFTPKCPVGPATKAWVDSRMQWLADQFGMQVWHQARAVEPTGEFFPDPFDRSERAVRCMLDRVCNYMAIPPQRITLRLYAEQRRVGNPLFPIEGPRTAGQYAAAGQEIVAIEVGGLANPMSLVATMAHELAHARLLGENRLSRDEEDLEILTDLATVFFGLGIFCANSAVQYDQWHRQGWSGWSVQRTGYLDEPTFGYALALWTFVRHEDRPRWMRHVRPNVRGHMKESLRFIQATADSPFASARLPKA